MKKKKLNKKIKALKKQIKNLEDQKAWYLNSITSDLQDFTSFLKKMNKQIGKAENKILTLETKHIKSGDDVIKLACTGQAHLLPPVSCGL